MTVRAKIYATAAAFLASTLLAGAASAVDGHAVGDTQMCIDTQNIAETPVIDSKTIVVKLHGHQGYKRIDLANACQLSPGRGFAWSTSINKLCKQDPLYIMEAGRGTCMIDKIVTIDEKEAKTLMARK